MKMTSENEESIFLLSGKKKPSYNSEEYSKELDYRMGLRKWMPDWLQSFNSIKWFLFLLAIFSLVQGIVVSGLVAASIQSIEKEFGFSSKVSGLILASNEIGAILLITFISYFGSRNKPKWMAIGALVSGVGGFLFALPKFLKGAYEPQRLEEFGMDICFRNSTIQGENKLSCNDSLEGNNILYAVLLVVAQIIMGAGTAPIRTLGPAYLDENVSPRESPIYLGIWFNSMMMGPGLGFIVGSFFIKVYTDLEVPNQINYTDHQSEWVGAWWLGFVSLSGIFVLIGALFMLFPKKMKDGITKRDESIQRGELPSSDENMKFTLSAYKTECLKLCLNSVFMLSSFALSIKTLYIVGLSGFLVKITADMFGTSIVTASLAIGIVFLVGMSCGIMGGACMMRKSKVKTAAKTGAKICVIISFLSILSPLVFFIPGCRNTNLAGVIVPYQNSIARNSLTSRCNSNCSCSENMYFPVCGSDGITYHSPCYAGCQVTLETDEKKTFFVNCTCIHAQMTSNTAGFHPISNHGKDHGMESFYGSAHLGRCDRKCKNFLLFIILSGIFIILSFFFGTPHKIMVLRCVPDNKRSFALGMQYLIMKGFSFMPGPIIFGAVVDIHCITWSYDSCGRKKNCLDYDIDNMSYKIVLIGVCTAVVSTILYFLCWWFYPVTTRTEESNGTE